MTIENCTKKDFLTKNKDRFGIIENPQCEEFLDICAQHVRCIGKKYIRTSIPLPSINGVLNNCHGIVSYPGEIDTDYASFRVTDAKEELVDCMTDHPGVRVTVNGQIVVRSMPSTVGCNPCPPTYIAIPVQVVDEVLYDFFSTKDGSYIQDLKTELPYIEGSCMVIQLSCSIYKDTCGPCPRYVARIRGNVVDKLWKRENIWVEGIRPYPENSVTFCDTFSPACPYNDDDPSPSCDCK